MPDLFLGLLLLRSGGGLRDVHVHLEGGNGGAKRTKVLDMVGPAGNRVKPDGG